MNGTDLSDPRFWTKVDAPSPYSCWRWAGAANNRGYGQVRRDGQSYLAHRYAYTLAVGPIPAGYEIDHLCLNALCVNPAHLEAVTPAVNRRRQVIPQPERCGRGHVIDGQTTTQRYCRECRRDSNRRWREQAR